MIHYKINENFIVTIFKSKLIDIKKDAVFAYKKGEIVIPANGQKYTFLSDIYWGKILVKRECQIFVNIPQKFLDKNPKLPIAMELDDVDQLDGENPFNFSWVEIE